jgi:hypothetical protein
MQTKPFIAWVDLQRFFVCFNSFTIAVLAGQGNSKVEKYNIYISCQNQNAPHSPIGLGIVLIQCQGNAAILYGQIVLLQPTICRRPKIHRENGIHLRLAYELTDCKSKLGRG